MAGATHEDGFHEIQLNGKQLVFLFMAVTVVSVVIFLCGVLVGRGVRLDRPGAGVSIEADGEPPAPPPVEVGGPSTKPIAAGEKTTYQSRLEGTSPPPDKIQPADTPPAPKAEPVDEPPATAAPATEALGTEAQAPKPAPRDTAAPAPQTPVNAALAEPPGPGVAVQVSAFRVRSEADALATRLNGKGYKAYVVPPAAGAPALFRVRVGKFKEQREADQVAERLKKEEKFDPWIVR